MKDSIFIYGTQKRFLGDLSISGLKRDTAAVFLYCPDEFQGDITFTLAVAIYHGISLEVQDIIIKYGYKTFSDFYGKFDKYLPAIVLFSHEIGEKKTSNFLYKSTILDYTTYPYYKIQNIGKLDNIAKIIEIKIGSIMMSEKHLGYQIKSSNDRFFTKDGTKYNVSGVNLIDKEQLFVFCMNLAKVIKNEVINTYNNHL